VRENQKKKEWTFSELGGTLKKINRVESSRWKIQGKGKQPREGGTQKKEKERGGFGEGGNGSTP